MPHVHLSAPSPIEAGFARIRRKLAVPEAFPPEVEAEAAAARPSPGLAERLDARHVALVAIDPAGSTDLDQALCLERRGDGYRFHYAIADVAAFVVPGGTVDAETRRRGVTLYSPDGRAPLHPTVLSEDRISLLPGSDKAALLWTIDLDERAEPVSWHVERAVVRTRAAISYPQAQAAIDGSGQVPTEVAGSIALLAEVGDKRQAREAERGGISLNLPAQRVEEEADGTYRLAFELPLPVEGWNAQLSLLTGIVAGRTMVEAKVGILRTLPAAAPDAITTLRRTAHALGLAWPRDEPYPAFVRGLAGDASPRAAAFLIQAAHTLRGAGYVGFDGTVPDHPEHGAIASVYAHVTAPLRRLVDRFGNEILLALHAGTRPPGWALEALDELPTLMGQAGQRESTLERALLDYAEAVVLAPCVGQRFTGTVVDLGRNRAQVQIADPAVVATVAGDQWRLAQELDLRLAAADPDNGTITFDPY